MLYLNGDKVFIMADMGERGVQDGHGENVQESQEHILTVTRRYLAMEFHIGKHGMAGLIQAIQGKITIVYIIGLKA